MPLTKHIVSSFDQDLQDLRARISEMGGLAEEQLNEALEAAATRDSDRADAVIASDDRLDEMEQKLEEAAIQIMALRQPMASDLREVVAAIKIASRLERIGDLAKNIAKRSKVVNQNQPLKIASSIIRMGRLTQRLLSETLDAYTTRDTELCIEAWNSDVAIDEMYNSVSREVITYTIENPQAVSLAAQLLFVAKNLERIGDHATFISEMTFFVVEGRPLGDNRPKGDPMGELP